jgi:hypothetical protein
MEYQIAGHSQSPFGILATTSTRPYVMDLLPAVVSLAERTGLIMAPVVTLLVVTQSGPPSGFVQVLSDVRFKV